MSIEVMGMCGVYVSPYIYKGGTPDYKGVTMVRVVLLYVVLKSILNTHMIQCLWWYDIYILLIPSLCCDHMNLTLVNPCDIYILKSLCNIYTR